MGTTLAIVMMAMYWNGCVGNNKKGGSTHPVFQRNNVNELIQQAIDFVPLQQFLHPSVKGRAVLCISGAELPYDLKLSTHGQSVKIVSSPIACDNCITFHTINIKKSGARVIFDYAIEGVRCDLSFELKPTGWTLISSKLTEH
jgi:hypothetical protein